MERIHTDPRPDWQQRVEAQGFLFHTPEGETYWDESAYYRFSAAEVDAIEAATVELNRMCLEAVQSVLDEDQLDLFGIPKSHHAWIRQSWETQENTIYGRFDLAYHPGRAPKLLEYNADTPTSLLEAAVIQWHWLKDTQPGRDQFNSIHERLIEAWKQLGTGLGQNGIHFANAGDSVEDFMTVNYLRDTAVQAGLPTAHIPMKSIGWNARQGRFLDPAGRAISTAFKLYPWEWMFHEAFAANLLRAPTRWLEAPWKAILSSKAILVTLWELFPNSPYLLRAEREPFGLSFIQKPLLGREGANMALVLNGEIVQQTDGPYGKQPSIYQQACPLPVHGGNHALVGSWMVNGNACGMGIREDDQPITGNTSRFVPHCMD